MKDNNEKSRDSSITKGEKRKGKGPAKIIKMPGEGNANDNRDAKGISFHAYRDIRLHPHSLAEEITHEKPRKEIDDLPVKNLRSQLRSIFLECIEALSQGKKIIPLNTLIDQIRIIINDIRNKKDAYLRTVFSEDHDHYEKNYLMEHSINVLLLSTLIGMEMGYRDQPLLDLCKSSLLHDIAFFLDDHYQRIISKKGPINFQERSELRSHPRAGSDVLKGLFGGEPSLVPEVLIQVHEREDGSGYPAGLKGDQIHPFAGIIGLSDTLESMTHYRPHRSPMRFASAIRSLLMEEKGLFPLKVIKAAIRTITPYPPGSIVRLNTGEMARVIEINPERRLRPLITLLDDSGSEITPTSRYIDLTKTGIIHIISYQS